MLLHCLKCKRNTDSKYVKVTSCQIPLMVLFCFNKITQVNTRYKMNEIENKLLLAGDKFMPEMHLRLPGFTYSACGPFTKSKERIKNVKKQDIHDIFIKTN